MTCIVGLVDKGDVYLGGDSAGVAGLSLSIRADEKVFINGPFVMGFTTSFRMGQLLRYKFNPAVQTVSQNDMQYMVTTFIDAVRSCFSDNGFGSKSDGGTFLVGYHGQLYTIAGDFQVGIPSENYDSVGSGSDLALGAMHATSKLDPKKRILSALQAASHFNAGVAAPFRIIKLPKTPVKKAKK